MSTFRTEFCDFRDGVDTTATLNRDYDLIRRQPNDVSTLFFIRERVMSREQEWSRRNSDRKLFFVNWKDLLQSQVVSAESTVVQLAWLKT